MKVFKTIIKILLWTLAIVAVFAFSICVCVLVNELTSGQNFK